jgi:8-oxo-dGTP pyrophosphatase MutT (NUDIX family)
MQDDELFCTVLKSEAHQKGLLHRCVIAGVKTPDGRIMMIRQASDRQDAGQYVFPVGGHVKSGESLDEALFREAEEEMNFKKFNYQLLGKIIYYRKVLGRIENHYFYFYEIVTEEQPLLGPEADDFVYLSEKEFIQTLKEKPEYFGQSGHFAIKNFYPQFLN